MAEKDRPGDDVPGDDELLADAAAGDDIPDDDDERVTAGGGGTALAERTKDETPKAKKSGRGPFGRLGGFFREVTSELRKVIWPTRKELLTYTGVVIVFVVVMTSIVAGLDYGFGKAILWALG